MSRWELFLDTFFRPDLIQEYWPAIAGGVLVTLEVAVLVVVTGILCGLVLAMVRAYRIAPVNALIVVFVDVFRALPPLVLILLVYFGLPALGLVLSSSGPASSRSARASGRRRARPGSASPRPWPTSSCPRRCA